MKINCSVVAIFIIFILPNITYGAENPKSNQHLQAFLIQTQNNLALLNARTLENQAALLKRVEELTQKCATLTQIIERQEQALQTLHNDQNDLLNVLNSFFINETKSQNSQEPMKKPDQTKTPSSLELNTRLHSQFPHLKEQTDTLFSNVRNATQQSQNAMSFSIETDTDQKIKQTQENFEKQRKQLRKQDGI